MLLRFWLIQRNFLRLLHLNLGGGRHLTRQDRWRRPIASNGFIPSILDAVIPPGFAGYFITSQGNIALKRGLKRP